MKSIIVLIAICFSLFIACKSKEKIFTSTETKEITAVSKTAGKVSHQYKSAGCSTVIIIEPSVLDAPHILIPKDKLPESLDIDGLGILFNYRTLRMPNPVGCTTGIPVELFDVLKIK